MADPLQQPGASPRPAWVRLCQWLWKQRGFVWGTIILGIVLNIFATWLVTPWGTIYSNTPLGSVLDYPLLWALVGLGLLIFTGGLRLINRRYPTPATQGIYSRKNRRIMLDRVTAIWIAGFLENSLYYDGQLLPLSLRERVGSRYDLKLYDPLEPAQSLPPDTKILEVFDNPDKTKGQLLILGEPGAGKTTLLLELARDLLQRARSPHSEAPIPVVLTLSSWATKQLPLEQWVIEELKTKYQVAPAIGQAWVANNQLLLLLDGLDEVAPHAQPACIRAVNSYMRQAHRSLVVCSRTKEYLEQPERLSLRTAVAVQPLSPQQVDDYLSALGEEVDGLQRALHQSEPLRGLATTPLLLKVLILAYHGESAQDLLPLVNTAPTDQQHRLFHDYVERMLQREGPRMRASEPQTKHWLAWLAHQMTEHHQTEFYLEQLQPDWLPTRRRAFYRWSIGLYFGLFFALYVGLYVGLLSGLLSGLVVGLIVGLLLGPVFWLFGLDEIEPEETLTWSWEEARYGLVGVPVGGLFVGLIFALYGGLFVGLVGGLVGGLVFGLFVGLLRGLTSSRQLTERLALSPNEWIRRSVENGLVGGLLLGLFFGLVYGLVGGQNGGHIGGLVYGLVYGLVGGLVLGLGAAWQPYILHFWLWQAECISIPWHYVAFLDDAAGQMLLRKVGGGYSFRHPLLQEYFASSEVVSARQLSVRAEARSGLQNTPHGDPTL